MSLILPVELLLCNIRFFSESNVCKKKLISFVTIQKYCNCYKIIVTIIPPKLNFIFFHKISKKRKGVSTNFVLLF